MFKTKNGNNKLTLEEFEEKLKKFNPVIEKRTLQILYYELNDWLIGDVIEMNPKWDMFDWAMRHIKEDKRNEWKALYINLAYDTPAGSLRPQDCPYCIALLDTTDGTIYSLDWIRNFIKEKSKNEKA